MLEQHNIDLKKKYDLMERDEVRFATYGSLDSADVVIIAYGTVARVCLSAIEALEQDGIKVAMVRPITLWPYPYEAVREVASKAKDILVVELSTGQMIEDVRLALHRPRPIHFHCRLGGMLVTPEEVITKVEEILSEKPKEAPDA